MGFPVMYHPLKNKVWFLPHFFAWFLPPDLPGFLPVFCRVAKMLLFFASILRLKQK
jgi:hypothetical protein